MPSTAPQPKQPQSEGIKQDVPEWLAALGVKRGEYLTTSKLREQRAAKALCIGEAGRVHACLGLHTMGFQQQLAVKMAAGKRVPIGFADITAETGIRRDNVKRAMAQLKAWGLADWENSTKGQIKLYAWAVPRPVEERNCTQLEYNPEIVLNPEYNPEAAHHIRELIKQHKIKNIDGIVLSTEYISQVENAEEGCRKAFDEYKKAKKVLRDAVKGTQPEDAYKDERNERNIYIKEDPPPPPFVEESTGLKAEDEEPPENINPEPPKTKTQGLKEAKAEYPATHWDDAKASQAYLEHIKSRVQHKVLIEGIRRHKESERWQDEGGRWIPLASNFIAKRLYEYHPPPKLKTISRAGPKRDAIAEMLRAEEAKEKAKAQGGGS